MANPTDIQRVSLDGAAMNPLLIVGSVAYDTIHTPTKTGERILGGSAAYAALAASYYSLPQLVGVVGNDFAESDMAKLRGRQIDLDGLQVDKSGPTFFWAGRYHENFNRRDTLEIQLNVFEKFRPELPASYKNTQYVMLGNIHPALQMHVRNELPSDAFVIADTIDLWIETERDKFMEVVRSISCLVINDEEVEQLTLESNYIDGARKLLRDGPEMVIIKKGSHGAYLFHKEGMFALPAYPVTNLQDPTGAGDSFAGAFLGYLAATGSTDFKALKQAMLYATATASLTVEEFSTDRLETAGIGALEERRQDLLRMITV